MESPNGMSDESENENASNTSTQFDYHKRKERSNFINSLFCKGVPSGAESITSLQSGSAYASVKSSDKKPRFRRIPLTSDYFNKGKAQVAVSTPPAHHAGPCGFPDTISALLAGPSVKAGKGALSQTCDCDGACISCWDAHSSHLASFPTRSPQDSNSIPVIEDLGVTPKSKARPNKYSTSNAMNPPGNAIPTPAPVQKKHTPVFGSIPEAITATPISGNKVEGANEDDFLPEDLTETKADSLMYTEADLRERIEEALSKQESELETKYASASEDSATKDLQLQLEKQLEEQGMLWNKDLQERLEANRNHYRKKQSVFKARITELEEKCQSLEKRQEDNREEHGRQTEQLMLEMSRRQEAHDSERTKLINEIAKQNERISDLSKDKSNQQQEQSCTPGFIRDLQHEIRSLQIEKELCGNREAEMKTQRRSLEESISNLEKSLSESRGGRTLDQQKISELETQIVELDKEKSSLHDDLVALRKKISSRDGDVTTMEAKFLHSLSQEKELEGKLEEKGQQEIKLKAGLQRCIRILSVRPNMDPEASTPFDESDWVDASLETLLQLVNRLSDQLDESQQRAKKAEENVRKETDSRVASELEVARLSDILESFNHDGAVLSGPSDEDSGAVAGGMPNNLEASGVDLAMTKSIGKIKALETLQQFKTYSKYDGDGAKEQGDTLINSYLHIITSEVLTQLRQDIESLKRYLAVGSGDTSDGTLLCRLNDDKAWVLPKDAVDELNKLVEDIYAQLEHLQAQHGRQASLPATDTSANEEKISIEPSYILDQLESKRLALAKKEKDYVDEVRKVQKLTEELEQLRNKPGHLLSIEEQSMESNDSERESNRVDPNVTDLVKELDNLQAKLAEAETNSNRLKEDIVKQEAKNTEILRALGLSQEQATILESHLAKLLDSKGNITNVSQIRSEIQQALERHYAEILEGDEKQVQELLVMLELKQENEKLNNKVQEQEEVAESMVQIKEKLEQQVSDLTTQCQNLSEGLEEKEHELDSLSKRASKLEVHQDFMEKKVDAIISHIDIVESEQEITVEPVLSSSENGESSDRCTVDLQKLERVERHLLYVWDDFTTKKVEELTNQRQLLTRMKVNIAKHKEESQQTILELQTKIAELEKNLEEKLQSIEELKSRNAELEKTSRDELRENQKTIHELQSKNAETESIFKDKWHENQKTMLDLQAKIAELERNLLDKRHEITAATSEIESLKLQLSEALDAVSNANQQSQQGFQSMVDANEKMATLATDKEKLTHKVSALEIQLENLAKEKEVQVKKQEEDREALVRARSECARLEEQLVVSKGESSRHSTTVKHLESQLEAKCSECEGLDKLIQLRSGNFEEELLKRTADLEAKANATIKNCEEQVRQVREDHAKEIDELLSQLDLVEAEHTENFGEKEKAVKEKDAIIAALGAQLAESQSRITALEEDSEAHVRDTEQARQDVLRAKNEADSYRNELENLGQVHANLLESERVKRETAVEEAREETIQEATAQFENFNALYRTMTQNYKSAAAKVHDLEAELQASQQALQELSQDHASRIASLNSDLAEMKAEYARADAEAKRTVKEHLDDLEHVKEAERDLRSRLTEAEASSRSIQKLLATVVAEKEELIAENEELKSVCEEAMSLAETTHS